MEKTAEPVIPAYLPASPGLRNPTILLGTCSAPTLGPLWALEFPPIR
jgi:hypothetical protein